MKNPMFRIILFMVIISLIGLYFSIRTPQPVELAEKSSQSSLSTVTPVKPLPHSKAEAKE
jgi:uncharacterized membrane protein